MGKKLKEIRKALMKGEIVLHPHAIRRMKSRGYSKSDVAMGIMNGYIHEMQQKNSEKRFVVSGKDTFMNPIIVVVLEEKPYLVITVMPPIDHQRFTDCV